MKKLRLAIIGFGNLGQYALQAAQMEPDVEVCGVVDPDRAGCGCNGLNMKVAAKIDDIEPVDAALLCIPTLKVSEIAPHYLARGISTVDAFDLHGTAINDLKQNLDRYSKAGGCTAIVAAGWDPGIDSLLRAVLKIAIPRGNTFTNYGPGMSLGHSVAARSLPGVRDAVAITYPLSYGKHRRHVHIIPEEGMDIVRLTADLLANPYFAGDETTVMAAEDLSMFKDHGHGALIERKGIAGQTHNQHISCRLSVNNPAVTSQVMICAARALRRCQPGAYSLFDLPLGYFFNESEQQIIGELA